MTLGMFLEEAEVEVEEKAEDTVIGADCWLRLRFCTTDTTCGKKGGGGTTKVSFSFKTPQTQGYDLKEDVDLCDGGLQHGESS